MISPEWVRMMVRFGAHQNVAYADLTSDLDEAARAKFRARWRELLDGDRKSVV